MKLRTKKWEIDVTLSKKAKAGMAILVAICLVATVSATYLTFFNEVQTTMNVEQSVKLDGMSYDEIITHDIPDAMAGCCYCFDHTITNDGCEPIYLEMIEWGEPDLEGIDVHYFEYVENGCGGEPEMQTVHLAQKEVVWGETPWSLLQDGAWADVDYYECGEDFEWEITYSGLETGTEYTLIYYGNFDEYWTSGPITVLGTFTANGGTASGSVDVNSMPYPEDENAQRDISEEGETYTHQRGAKIWIVPSDATDGNDITDWGMADDFLFETDLISYDEGDCYEEPTEEPGCPDCGNGVDIEFPIYLEPGDSLTFCICYKLDMLLAPGLYTIHHQLVPGLIPA